MEENKDASVISRMAFVCSDSKGSGLRVNLGTKFCVSNKRGTIRMIMGSKTYKSRRILVLFVVRPLCPIGCINGQIKSRVGSAVIAKAVE